MPRYIVTATEASSLEANAPTSQQILAALSRLPAEAGRWVGPAPRVTRTNRIGDNPSPYRTTFAWPMDIESADRVAYNREQILAALNTIDNSALLRPAWGDVTITPYSERLNGPESFWTSGEANRTRTRDDWSYTTDRLLAPDNAVGPNDPAVRNPTPGETLDDGADSLVKLAKGIALLGLAVGVVYVGVNYMAKHPPGRGARRNPRRPALRGDEWITGMVSA